MHDPERVRLGDRFERLGDEIDRGHDRERAVRRHEAFEVLALQALHHDVRRARLEDVDVVDANDVFAADPPRGSRLLNEAGDDVRVSRELGQEALDGDPLLEVRVPGREHDAHSAQPQRLLDH